MWLLLAANSLYSKSTIMLGRMAMTAKLVNLIFLLRILISQLTQLRIIKVNHNVNFSATVASLCDSAGILQLYTNGVAIYDKNGKKIPYSDSLNLGVYFDSDKKYGFSVLKHIF